ncbi:MAG: hypothetical protein PHQ72_07715 [Hespellia sp.]|nr:hypothetical protein [Hespellia sp.]
MGKRNSWKCRLLSVVLALTFVLANVVPAGNVYAEDLKVSQEEISNPEQNADSTEAASDNNQPDGSQSDINQSDNNQPDGSQSDINQSDNNQPDGSQSDINQPDDNQPDDSQSDSNQPDSNQVLSTQQEIADVNEEGEVKAQAQNNGITVTVELCGYNEHIATVQVTMPEEYYKLSDYGFEIPEEKDPGQYTMLHALAEYEYQKNIEEGIARSDVSGFIDAGSTGYISDIEGYMDLSGASAGNAGWNTWKNGVALYDSTSDTVISQGDKLTFAMGWYHYNPATYEFLGNHYTNFTSIPNDAKANQKFAVTLSAISSSNENHPAGITVSAIDGNGEVAATGKTDSSGTASLRITTAGTYHLTAIRRTDYYDWNNEAAIDITIPSGEIVVADGDEITDEAAVQKAADELAVSKQLTENVTLSTEADYGVSVAWTTSDAAVITADGVIKRTVMADKQVTLTAVITRGSVSREKTFPITVKGYELLESLSVTPGAIEKTEVYQSQYTYYVKNDVKAVTLKVLPSQDATLMMGDITAFISGDRIAEQEKVISLSDVEPGNSKNISLKVFLGSKGNGTVTVQIKKYGTPGDTLTDLSAAWPQHFGNDSNNAVSAADTAKENASLLWESFAGGDAAYGTNGGAPILVNGKIYVARNGQLQILNAGTGTVEKSSPLKSGLYWFSSYITYGGGKIFVPLADGTIQCFDAVTLKSLFVTQVPGNGFAPISSLYYKDGMLYTGFTDYQAGQFAAYETTDFDQENEYEVIEPAWTYGSNSYYGMGAVSSNGYLVFAGDADAGGNSTVAVVDAVTGEEKSTLTLSGNVRCSLVEAEGSIWLTTQAAQIYRLAVGTDGRIVQQASAALPATTNASPVVTGGKVYITGGTWSGGYVSVFDMNLNALCTAGTTGQANTPTVSVSDGTAYVYFTQNAEPGGVYVAKVTADNKITVNTLYTPAHTQYCMSNVLIGDDGTIYYVNDSGYMFALKAEQTQNPPAVIQPVKPTETIKNDNKNKVIETKKATTKLLKANVKSAENDTETDTIVEEIQSETAAGKKSLTIKNVPEVLEAEVFAELKKHEDFQLILDCGTYTMSIRGSEVKNEKASLSARLIEEESSLSKEQEAKLGKFQQLKFEQDGELPGTMTIVYQLPKQMSEIKEGLLYKKDNLKNGEEVVVSSPYAMFTLSKSGTYILAEKSEEDLVTVTEKKEGTTKNNTRTADESAKGYAVIWTVLGVIAVIVLGGIGVAVKARRRKERTWEE